MLPFLFKRREFHAAEKRDSAVLLVLKKIPRFPSCIVFSYFGKYFALSDIVCGPELALPGTLVSWDSNLKIKNLLCDFLGAVSRTRGWKG